MALPRTECSSKIVKRTKRTHQGECKDTCSSITEAAHLTTTDQFLHVTTTSYIPLGYEVEWLDGKPFSTEKKKNPKIPTFSQNM